MDEVLPSGFPRVFLLSPALMGGPRSRMLLRPEAEFELALRLRAGTASLGEIYAFISGLYFRGKLAYAQAFAAPPSGVPHALVMVPGRGLIPPATIFTLKELEETANVQVDEDLETFFAPLVRDAERLNQHAGADCRHVLLGSVATRKYSGPLGGVFGERLLFPKNFLGIGDMSRGSIMLRHASAREELVYWPVARAGRTERKRHSDLSGTAIAPEPTGNAMHAVRLLQRTYKEWNDHDAPRLGAALSYYTVLSLAPLVLVTVSLIALFLGSSNARTEIIAQFQSFIGSEGARTVENVLKSSKQQSQGGLPAALGLVTLLLGASGVFLELRSALNKLWDVKPAESSSWFSFVRERFLSFGMVLAIGFLLLVSLILSAALGVMGKFFGNFGILPAPVWEAFNFAVSLGVVTFTFALIFRYVSDIRVEWRPAFKGGLTTAVLFTIGKTLIGIYLGRAAVGSAYGAAGSLVVIAVWVYYSAQIFYFGAELTRLVSERAPHDEVAAQEMQTLQPSSASSVSPERAASKLAAWTAAGLAGIHLIRGLVGRRNVRRHA